MNETEIARMQTYLRILFANDRIDVDAVKRRGGGGPVEVRVDNRFVGTLRRDEQDGEVSFSLAINVLKQDLPRADADPLFLRKST